MPRVELDEYQIDAIRRMKKGCILNGGVGSGKSRTALAFYCKQYGGVRSNGFAMTETPKDLYIITTAKKRDTLEWEKELSLFLLNKNKDHSIYNHNIIIDSWNNIQKYHNVYDAFFIFDEDRVTGSGAWVKAFKDIARKNFWIILSATPGDTWTDYLPVFMANGFYKTKGEFNYEHVIYVPHLTYPKIQRFINEERLEYYRNLILVDMDYNKDTVRHDTIIKVDYDKKKYDKAFREKIDPFTGDFIENPSKMCYILRKVTNSDASRIEKLKEILEIKKKLIIFYNYDYELYLLEEALTAMNYPYAQWNGHKHEVIPKTKKWCYLVQYSSGAEGWNCIETDSILFWSQNYSYKIMEQAKGRIDRRNTPFKDLIYYHFRSDSLIDKSITIHLKNKKIFNEKRFCLTMFKPREIIITKPVDIPKPVEKPIVASFEDKYKDYAIA